MSIVKLHGESPHQPKRVDEDKLPNASRPMWDKELHELEQR